MTGHHCLGKQRRNPRSRNQAEGALKAQCKEADETLRALLEEREMKDSQVHVNEWDHANNKSNQKNLGTIKSSNLCTEIIEYSSPDETAVCNLTSLTLSPSPHLLSMAN
ncbi:hypothetical protein CPB84DRAFT_1755777 [Gymnopilus junonius]|uniref:Ribonucleotide reductase large subunit C-terminal domain-containing protein n=1 Tax=Gymnopilus junonius TaxID=109634 RepID=A0A9P5N773_GYMJU|nr:hypothetical protein CPB84DRAFT_1755777 [Gymnopilus junonius]